MVRKLISSLVFLVILTTVSSSKSQTVLYDFDDLSNPFGHFGAITTDTSIIVDCDGEVGNACLSHTGDFTASPFNPNDFGLLELGPLGSSIDLSSFVGYSIDARFIRDTDGLGGDGNELFTGLSPIKLGIQWDPSDPCNSSMNACSDLYDTPIELTEEFQTYTVLFEDFLEDKPRNSAQIKMLMLTGLIDPNTGIKTSDWSDGIGRLEFDNIIGILAPESIPGDYNGDDIVDAADFVIWRDSLGSTTVLDANGDDTGASMGVIDAADYDIWVANYGNVAVASSQAASVPEPTALVTILVGVLAVSFVRKV